jgi:hypothetical protein
MKIDTHTVAALLKAFFAALPEPIFSYRVCDLVLEATGTASAPFLSLSSILYLCMCLRPRW